MKKSLSLQPYQTYSARSIEKLSGTLLPYLKPLSAAGIRGYYFWVSHTILAALLKNRRTKTFKTKKRTDGLGNPSGVISAFQRADVNGILPNFAALPAAKSPRDFSVSLSFGAIDQSQPRGRQKL